MSQIITPALANSVYHAAGGAAAFQPDSISGLTIWLEPSYGLYQNTGATTPATNDGDTVALWQDKSNNGCNFTTLAGQISPTLKTNLLNGRNGVQFNQSGGAGQTQALEYHDSNPDHFKNPYTMIYVGRCYITSGGENRVVAGYAQNYLVGYWGNKQDQMFGGSFLSNPNTTVTTNWKMYEMTCNGTTGNFYQNGTLIASGANGLTAPVGGLVLGSMSNGGERTNCQVCELLVYNTVLSTGNRQAVESYLQVKYGL